MKHIVPVVSGKGGVGKSTVAVNLAVSLARASARVALIDCDFYGPSIPILLGGGEARVGSGQRLIPAEKFGLKYISLGFFLDNPNQAVIWRGPMLNKALRQLFEDVDWGEIDYCIVDMPPGTGDAAISLVQCVKLSGALVVTTPQEVALADVRKAINMLRQVKVEVLGLVQNMSAFIAPDGRVFDIFGSGGGQALAAELGFPLLADIPLDIGIRESGDKGLPVACQEGTAAFQAFRGLALKLIDILAKKKSGMGLRIIQ